MKLEQIQPLDDEHELGVCFHREPTVTPDGLLMKCPNCGDTWVQWVEPTPRAVIRKRTSEGEEELAVTRIRIDLWTERGKRAKELLAADHPRSCDTYEGGSCDCGLQDRIYEFLEEIARS